MARARDSLDDLLRQRSELEAQVNEEIARIDAALRTSHAQLERLQVRPRKSDIALEPLALVWMPWFVDESGTARPAYEW